LRAQSFDSAGHATSDVVMVEPTHTMTSNDMALAIPFSLATEADGGFIVTLQGSGDGADVYEKSFEIASAPAPGVIPVSTIPDATLDVSGHGGQPVAVPTGNFMVDGGAGLDVLAFASAHTAYSVVASGGVFVLDGPEGHDLLTSVERLQFSDHTALALDVYGNAGMAYRLYQAAFHRVPDLGGLGFQMHELDTGVSFQQVASNFLASPEFQATYGALDNAAFVTQLYANVLHRAPDADGLAYHLSNLAAGEARSGILIGFSESPENQANVIGTIANGMEYIPV
jgi:hypothetical protein